MRPMKNMASIFLITLTTLFFSACGQMGLSGILGASGLMGADAGDAGLSATDDDGDVIELNGDGDDAGYNDNGFSGASHATDAGSYDGDDDGSLIEDGEEGEELMGTGSLSPEPLPVTMSKLFPEDGECNEDSEGAVVGITTDEDVGSAYMMAASDDEDGGSRARTAKHKSRSARFHFDPSVADISFRDTAYQCQYTGVDEETGVELFNWVEIDFQDYLDFLSDSE